MRLDTARAFATLVEEQVRDPAMRRRIFENTIYRQITTSLTGSQEYAATLALFTLAREKTYDLIVLDTPPTANALDFLDAPKRIAAAVSSPAIKWFARPTGGGLSFQRLRMGGALVLRRVAKLVGSTFLEDLAAFLVDFQDVLSGFLTRAQAVDSLLRSADTAFLLVLAPVTAAVDEALYFHGRLQAAGVPVASFVANRVQPAPGLTEPAALAEAIARDGGAERFAAGRGRRGGGPTGGAGADLSGDRGHGEARAGPAGGTRARDADHSDPPARSRRRQPGRAAGRGRLAAFRLGSARRTASSIACSAGSAPSGAASSSATASARRARP